MIIVIFSMEDVYKRQVLQREYLISGNILMAGSLKEISLVSSISMPLGVFIVRGYHRFLMNWLLNMPVRLTSTR